MLGQPQAGWRLAGLIEDIDRNAAARVPIAADPQPQRLQLLIQPFGDLERAGLVEAAVAAKGAKVELQRLALDQARIRRVVDNQMGEVGLAGDRAEAVNSGQVKRTR